MSSPLSPGGPLANGLYPIVRRARRPLIIQDDDAGPPASAASPSEAVPALPPESLVDYSQQTKSREKSRHAGKSERK